MHRSNTGTRYVRRFTAALAACAVAWPASAARAQTPAPAPDPPPSGRLVDVGGYRLHLDCTGRGSPTVVLSPGAGDFSWVWSLVQPEVARYTRVCSYDRAGEAWSDLGPRPRTATQEAFDLRRVLAAAGERGPYVLVGQSYGGNVVRLFAADHPSDVAGMVLVDVATPQAPLNLNGRVAPAMAFTKGRPIPAPRTAVTAEDGLTAEALGHINDMIKQFDIKPSIDRPFQKLPPDVQRLQLWALGRPGHFLAGDPDYAGEEAVRIDAENHRPLSLGDLPLVVLIRDTTVERSHDPLHVAHQTAVAGLSRRGRAEVVAGAGHHIHVDRPEVVVAAIREVVDQARADRRRPRTR